MIRLFLSALAALVVVRVLFGLFQAIAAGMREGEDRTVGPGRRADGSPSDSERRSSPGSASGRTTTIDRTAVIDVPFTEIRDEEPVAETGRERGAG
jgi:hypothetical protein